MASELLVSKLREMVGLHAIIFSINNFRFECKIISCDGEFVEFYDTKKFKVKLMRISEIAEVEETNNGQSRFN